MEVKHRGKNAVEVDGVLVSYRKAVARIVKKEERREVCRHLYHLSVGKGYFLAARTMLRNALVWRSREARAQSREWCYNLRGGKLNALQYKCSY